MENNKLFKLNKIEKVILFYLILISFLYKEKLTIDYNVFIIGVVIFVFSIFFNYKKFLLSFPFLLPFQYKGLELYNIHLSITDIAIILIIISFFIRLIFTKNKFSFKNYFLILFAFVFVSFLSILLNNKVDSFHLNYFIRFLEAIMIFFIFYMELKSKEDLLNLIKNIFYIAVFISVYNIYEFIFIRNGYNILTNISNFGSYRVLGVSSQPNFTGIFLALVFPVGIFFCKNHKVKTIFVLLTISGVFVTFSRAALLILFINLLFLPYIKKTIKIIMIFSFIIVIIVLPQIIKSRGLSVEYRSYKYKLLPVMLSKSSLIGTGFASYSEEYIENTQGTKLSFSPPSAHSTYLKILVETGITGFILFISFLLMILLNVLKNINIDEKNKKNLVIILFLLMVANLFTVMLVHLYFWVLLFLLSSFDIIFKEDKNI